MTNAPSNLRVAAQGIYESAYWRFMRSTAHRLDAALQFALEAAACVMWLLPAEQALEAYQQFIQNSGPGSPGAKLRLDRAMADVDTAIRIANTEGDKLPELITGFAIGFGRLAELLSDDFYTTPRELPHNSVSLPEFLLDLLPPGTVLERYLSVRDPAPQADSDPTVIDLSASATIRQVLVGWLSSFSKSEQSRRRSAVELLLKVAGLTLDDDILMLADLETDVGWRFHELSLGVGAGWGQAREDREKKAGALLKLVNSHSPPRWSQKPLSKDGARSRIAHTRAFLELFSVRGVRIPVIDWPSL